MPTRMWLEPRRPTRALAGRAAALALVVAVLTGIGPDGGEGARASVVDGISDQSLPLWERSRSPAERGFSRYFRDTWATAGHIAYARFVLQFDALARRAEEPYGRYVRTLEAWYREVTGPLRLTPVLAFYDFRPRADPLPDPAAYATLIAQTLRAFPAAVVEAWNEPNDDGVPAPLAARYAEAALGYCVQRHACMAVAGDFLDSAGAASYAQEYERDLTPPAAAGLANWGIHPYAAVNGSSGEAQRIADALPHGGAVWITEIGAYYCEKRDAFVGEAEQAARAQRLVRSVAPALGALHTFYYEFAYREGKLTPCSEQSDTALYGPGGAPRTAASAIYEALLPRPTAGSGPGEADMLLADIARRGALAQAQALWQ